MTKLYLDPSGIYVERLSSADYVDFSPVTNVTNPVELNEKIFVISDHDIIYLNFDCKSILGRIPHSIDFNLSPNSTFIAASNNNYVIIYADRKIYKLNDEGSISQLPFHARRDFDAIAYNDGHFVLYGSGDIDRSVRVAEIHPDAGLKEEIIDVKHTITTKIHMTDDSSASFFALNDGEDQDEDDDLFPFVRYNLSPQGDNLQFTWKSRIFDIPETNFFVI